MINLLSLELRLEYDDEKMAKAVYTAIEPDNKGYVDSELQGKNILLSMRSETAGSMKNTADDLLACIKIAEEASGLIFVVSGPTADLDSDTLFE